MRILISAYACNPYGGSEPGVGWTAVCRIAEWNDVFVLTDIHNKNGWERAREEGKIPGNVQVRFLRKKASEIQNPMIAHVDSWLSYAAYNRLVLDAARVWHAEERFDLCHQVTIAGWRMPSPLWKLPIPFLWGPIGGAGHIPGPFRKMLSGSARLFELARDCQTALASRSRGFLDCVKESAVVIAANEETELFLRPFRGGRPLVCLPIASLPADKVERFRRPMSERKEDKPLQLFAGGYMEGRKGVGLALHALARVWGAGTDFRYTVAGIGPEIPSLKRLAVDLGIADKVHFTDGYRGDEYVAALHATDVYFLPSFRESTPVTLLEACLAGCYPIVADTSAQGEIVRLCGGSAVPVTNMERLTQGLADAILWCAANRRDMADQAYLAAGKIAGHFASERYDATLRRVYDLAKGQVGDQQI